MYKPKLRIQTYIWISGVVAAVILLIVMFQVQSPVGPTTISSGDVIKAIDSQAEDIPDLSDVTRVLDELDAAANLLLDPP